jgi:hypothetical protein
MPQPPKSYEEIVRTTVPEPDSSWRPSPDQVKRAYEGFRALDPEEQALFERVTTTIATSGIDASRVDIEIDRDRVILHGTIASSVELHRIGELVSTVDGVREVSDQLVIG